MTPKQREKAKAKANEIQGAVLAQHFIPCCVCHRAVRRPLVICNACSQVDEPHTGLWRPNPRWKLIEYGLEWFE